MNADELQTIHFMCVLLVFLPPTRGRGRENSDSPKSASRSNLTQVPQKQYLSNVIDCYHSSLCFDTDKPELSTAQPRQQLEPLEQKGNITGPFFCL